MGVQVAGTCLHWSSQLLPAHAPSSSSHILASFFSPLCSRRDGGIICGDRILTYHVADHHHRSPFLRSRLLPRNRSSEIPKGRGRRRKEQNQRRAFSASLESFADDDDDEEKFVKRLQELAFQLEGQEEDDGMEPRIYSESRRNQEAESGCGATTSYDDAFSSASYSLCSSSLLSSSDPSAEPPWLSGPLEPPDWPASVQRNASSVDLPLSLRIIKRKKQQRWEEGSLLREGACCSVKKAFSSMVFIVQELHSFALQMRQTLFFDDIQGTLARVQQEIHASFVWLFQQIFSCTPTLMVSVMLLLANYTVYSMGHSTAIAAPNSLPPRGSTAVITHHQQESKNQPRFDHSSIKTFSVTGRTASFGGCGGGGGRKVRPVAGATDDGRSDGSSSSSYRSHTIPPDGISTVPATGGGEEEGSSAVLEEEAARTWSKMVEEASSMEASSRDGALMDPDTLKRLVSAVSVELEQEDCSDYYLRTELNYEQFLAQEPDNPLILSNFAQFLYLVFHDHDR